MSDERARLFVAVDVPAAERPGLAAWAREAVGAETGIRVLAPESLHVTLCFLGWRGLADAEEIGEAAVACARPAPALSTGGAAWLPPRRPGVLVVDLNDGDGALGELQACVVEVMTAAAAHEPETRPFRPHLTVARLKRGTRNPRRELPPPPQLSFAAESLTLYRSQLSRDGARYEPLARVAL